MPTSGFSWVLRIKSLKVSHFANGKCRLILVLRRGRCAYGKKPPGVEASSDEPCQSLPLKLRGHFASVSQRQAATQRTNFERIPYGKCLKGSGRGSNLCLSLGFQQALPLSSVNIGFLFGCFERKSMALDLASEPRAQKGSQKARNDTPWWTPALVAIYGGNHESFHGFYKTIIRGGAKWISQPCTECS